LEARGSNFERNSANLNGFHGKLMNIPKYFFDTHKYFKNATNMRGTQINILKT
jgi:hypothetical protein